MPYGPSPTKEQNIVEMLTTAEEASEYKQTDEIKGKEKEDTFDDDELEIVI